MFKRALLEGSGGADPERLTKDQRGSAAHPTIQTPTACGPADQSYFTVDSLPRALKIESHVSLPINHVLRRTSLSGDVRSSSFLTDQS